METNVLAMRTEGCTSSVYGMSDRNITKVEEAKAKCQMLPTLVQTADHHQRKADNCKQDTEVWKDGVSKPDLARNIFYSGTHPFPMVLS